MATPSKKTQTSRTQTHAALRDSENFDPNVVISPSPSSKTKSQAVRSAQSKFSPQTQGRIVAHPPPPPPQRARKFIVTRKGSKRAQNGLDFEKCRKEAYEALRASQEDFFRRDRSYGAVGCGVAVAVSAAGEVNGSNDGAEIEKTDGTLDTLDSGAQDKECDSEARTTRSLVVEEAVSSMPEPGSGRVKHLVKAFETLSIPKDDLVEKSDGSTDTLNLALQGLQQSAKTMEAKSSSTFVDPSAVFFPSRGVARYSSLESNGERWSLDSWTSDGGGRNKRNSSDILRRSWNKMLKVTSIHPFKLRTEQRGRVKEEQLIKKVKEMLMEEEKQRIPIAQGLPWTTDELEHLVKPPVKESTEPIDLVLHSDVRAVERAEFDQFVSERINFAEQLRIERELQRKTEEEEEVRRLRRELVPKAQPMPYFDRPFVPKRSQKPRTIPKEPRFHIRPRKSCSAASVFGI